MPNSERGWCIGFQPQPPHFVEELLEATTRMRLCEPCWRRWVRTDTGEVT